MEMNSPDSMASQPETCPACGNITTVPVLPSINKPRRPWQYKLGALVGRILGKHSKNENSATRDRATGSSAPAATADKGARLKALRGLLAAIQEYGPKNPALVATILKPYMDAAGKIADPSGAFLALNRLKGEKFQDLRAQIAIPVASVRTWATMDELLHDHQPDMIAISLQSGSNGNCFYVQSAGTGVLIDAGIPGNQAQRRLAQFNIDIRSVRAVLISHDHRDHVFAAGIYHRKFGLPVFMTKRTLLAARRRVPLGPFKDVKFFQAGETLEVGNLTIETVPTPHDGADGVAFVISNGRKRLGVLTDLGHVFDGLERVVRSLDAVFLESNYDPDMLREGRYPRDVQARIAGRRGHLSNHESAQLLARARTPRLKWACLAHLSGENNDPELAITAHRQFVPHSLPLLLASRHEAVGLWEV